MTGEEILEIAKQHVAPDGWMNGDQIMSFARALLASKPAVPQNEQEAFEAWAMGEFGLAALPTRQGLGYRLSGVDDSWAGWQARATAPAQSCDDAEQADEAVTDEKIANRFLKEDDFAALFTFHSLCADSECDGYTGRAETMERLAELGVVQRLFGGRGKRYGATAFGAWLVEAAFQQNPGWPLRTIAEHNQRESAGHALYLKESPPNSIAWVELDRNARESWRRKALPDLIDAAPAKESK